jgi:hypothetical protein
MSEPMMSPMSGSEFVRSRPLSLSTEEVIEEGIKLGIPMTKAIVYTTRSVMRRKKKLENEQGKKRREERSVAGSPSSKFARGASGDITFKFLREYVSKHGSAPKTAAVIAEGSGLKRDTVLKQLARLRKQKRVDYDRGDVSTLRILDESPIAAPSVPGIPGPQPSHANGVAAMAGVMGLLGASPHSAPVSPVQLKADMIKMRNWYQERADAFSRVIELYE